MITLVGWTHILQNYSLDPLSPVHTQTVHLRSMGFVSCIRLRPTQFKGKSPDLRLELLGCGKMPSDNHIFHLQCHILWMISVILWMIYVITYHWGRSRLHESVLGLAVRLRVETFFDIMIFILGVASSNRGQSGLKKNNSVFWGSLSNGQTRSDSNGDLHSISFDNNITNRLMVI